MIQELDDELTVSDYIRLLAEKSQTQQHELIPECLENFGLLGTRELTLQQAIDYTKWRGLQGITGNRKG